MIQSLLGLYKDTELISIGLVSEDNREFYGEITDFSRDKVDNWIKQNVLDNTVEYGNVPIIDICSNEHSYYVGTKSDIVSYLQEWLMQFDEIELVSDVCHYDMVLFIDLFGTAFDLPSNIVPSCYDINQDIAKTYNFSMQRAFDYNREQILIDNNVQMVGTKHNSLYDARVIKLIYGLLNK